MTITATDVTLTGTLTDNQGNTLNGTLTFTLGGFGNTTPRIAGTQLLPGLNFTTAVTNGTFSTSFYSNQIITPGPLITYYTIAFVASGTTEQTFNFANSYQFSPGVYDISQLTPLGSTISNTSLPNAVTPFTFAAQSNTFLTGLSSIGNFTSALQQFPLVGSATLSGNATAVTAISPSTYTTLYGIVRITFYAVADVVSLQFGNSSAAVDTANNYNWRHLSAAAGGTTFADTNGATTNLIQLAPSGTTLSRTIFFSVSNSSNKTKLVNIHPLTETANVATLPALGIGGGQWFNTTGQIGCFKALTAGGNNFGGSIAFYGSN